MVFKQTKLLAAMASSLSIAACGGSGSDDNKVVSPTGDTEAPVIVVNGPSWQSVYVGDTFTPPSATVTDNVDSNVELVVTGQVDTSKVGIYVLTYSATDKAGNKTMLDVTVEVKEKPATTPPPAEGDFLIYGAGNVSTKLNPEGYTCTYDYGNWIHSAGVVLPGVAGCDSNGKPIGEPTKLSPQVTGVAATKPVAAHRWWGSVSFLGEMEVGNVHHSAFITPDPMMARISNKGARILALPSGMRVYGWQDFYYQIPDPFAEVFDGIAIGNTAYDALDAKLQESSDGAMTVEWQHNGEAVMQATFVHGSPYAYFKAFKGDLELRTFRSDSGEKGINYQGENTLGVWTNVAGNRGNFLVVGEGETTFSNIETANIGVNNAAKELTLVLLPEGDVNTIAPYFAAKARNVVANVDIDYSVNRSDNSVKITHNYLGADGQPVDTIAGLFPMNWKNASSVNSQYQVRSSRGVVKFAQGSEFSYTLPYLGVLPYMPTEAGDYDLDKLKGLITEFIEVGENNWLNDDEDGQYTDTYWAGKVYGQVAELAAISRSIGMYSEADRFVNWLKAELSDWFTANTSGDLDSKRMFVYDSEWNTLLGIEESFGSHQQLNDHHFHYGYFVRAAAEICRIDANWCSDTQYGPMVELLIRDYAAGRDDAMFPYLRHFDPANGFSWASGNVNFVRGNNNESTSEAANAYGAMVLYGLITGKQDITDRGMYLHASTTNSFWEYWNNLDGFDKANKGTDLDNFPAGYEQITTSIIWGNGAVFSTWFSPAFAHILGIQSLPSNPLSLHLGQHPDYMAEYIKVGLSESSNQKPSGLQGDQWADIWWNITAMNDAEAAISDYNSATDYVVERGSSKAHTYHWLHTWKNLGTLLPESKTVTADHPAAVVFEKDGVKKYVVYNFSNAERTVSFSDGTQVVAAPNGFSLK